MQTKDVLGTRYRLDQRIAVGGMGDVWAGRDELLGRKVALKLLHPNLAADEGFRRRFRAEAQAVARLSHPGIVAVYDYGEDPDAAYLAMELVDGEPLSAVIRRRGRLDPAETMSVVAQSAEALAAAHAERLVHRDVKPANLLLRPDGRVKVTDFGIVRAADTSTLTRDGSVLGTVAYMSPEQVRGERATPASDIYALGVVAFECLTGSRPYTGGESIAVALAHLHDPVPKLPGEIPVGVRQLVQRMLQKDPAARPVSAAAVAESARRLAADGDATWAIGGLGGPVSGDGEDGAGPPTEPLTGDVHLDGRTDAVTLAGLAEPQTMALGPARPVVFRPSSPHRHWAPMAVLTVGALALALVLGSAFAGVASPAARTVPVPRLTGITLGAATHRLAALDLRRSLPPGDPSPGDLVVGERPAPGTRVARGTAVTLFLGGAGHPNGPQKGSATTSSTTTTSTTTTSPPPTTSPSTVPVAGPPGGGPTGGDGPPGGGPPGHGGDGPPGHGGGGGGPGH